MWLSRLQSETPLGGILRHHDAVFAARTPTGGQLLLSSAFPLSILRLPAEYPLFISLVARSLGLRLRSLSSSQQYYKAFPLVEPRKDENKFAFESKKTDRLAARSMSHFVSC